MPTSTLYTITGALTDGEILTAESVAEFLRLWIAPYPDRAADRLTARLAFLAEAAATCQDGLIHTAVENGFQLGSLTGRERELLQRPKRQPIRLGRWDVDDIPLIVLEPIRPSGETWNRPSGQCISVSPRTEISTLRGLIRLGFLTGFELVTAPASVVDPTICA